MGNAIQKHIKKVVVWDVDTSEMEYKKPRELDQNRNYVVRGFFISKCSKFGDGTSAVVITDDFLVNVPNGQTQEIKDFLDDQDVIDEVKKGEVSFSVREYISKGGTTGYNLDFI